jgi:RNA polymerase sigma-70 factor (ECF subfamily)
VDPTARTCEELVLACLDHADEASWTEFIRRFHPVIAGLALRVARNYGYCSPQVIDDVVQECYLKLCSKGLRAWKPDPGNPDALYGYLKVFAINLAHDHFKALKSKRRGGEFVTESREASEPTSIDRHSFSSQTVEREILIGQIDSCLKKVASERDCRIFWLYYRTGLAASAIAAITQLGLTSKGVESILFRLTRQVREQLVQTRLTKGIESGEGFRSA